jgi:chromosome segregation ATPase
MSNHRPSAIVQRDIEDAGDRIDRAEHQIDSAKKALDLLDAEQLPKSPSLARMNEILKDYNARKDGLQSDRQAAINNLNIAQRDAEVLAVELTQSQAEEARLGRIEEQWKLYDKAIIEAARAALLIYEDGGRGAVEGVAFTFRKTTPGPNPIASYGVAEISRYTSIRAHVMEGAAL